MSRSDCSNEFQSVGPTILNALLPVFVMMLAFLSRGCGHVAVSDFYLFALKYDSQWLMFTSSVVIHIINALQTITR